MSSLIGNRSWGDSLAAYVNRNLADDQKDEVFLEDTVDVNNAVLQCPADTRTLNNGRVIRSYAMNSGGTEWGGGNYTGIIRLSRSVSLAEVNDTTETVMFGERFNNNAVGKNGSTELGDYHTGHWKDVVHNKVNYYQVIFCDGNVEFLHGGTIDSKKMDS
ncbi:MAG: hypothetical protein MK132_24080 [Lentisphaerales bacterium]|nr:hypothetical protein [Lentisphaerales bacterium]